MTFGIDRDVVFDGDAVAMGHRDGSQREHIDHALHHVRSSGELPAQLARHAPKQRELLITARDLAGDATHG